jgi:Ras-related protein Rab-6A
MPGTEYSDLNISTANFKKYKVVFVGDQSVGKSSLIARYVYDTFDSGTSPTIGVDFMVKSIYSGGQTYKIHFWDTAGQERFKSLIPSYIKDCQIAILVYDLTNPDSFEAIDTWYENIRQQRGEDIILGLIGNKLDLDARVVSTKDGFKKAESIGAMFQECSAKTGENIKEFFKLVLGTLIDSAEAKDRDNAGPDSEDGVKLEDGITKPKDDPNTQKKRMCCG